MENSYKVIDIQNWNRKLHYSLFKNAVQPNYCVTLDIDITEFYNYVKNNKFSFTLAFIHAVSVCANKIENFRYRFSGDNVILYEKCNTEFTYLKKGDDLFYYICVPFKENIDEYIQTAENIISNQKNYASAPPANDAFGFSALPWITYTNISHTFSGDNKKASPAFDWGKFYEKDGRKYMPFTVQVHHSFVDGIHIAEFVEILENYLKNI